MKHLSNFLFVIIFICLFVKIHFLFAVNTVDHKDSQLNLYLDLIKYNTQEKIGILPYILEEPNGVYLEIGTGGDPIGDMLSKIPGTVSPIIIASDIDQLILDVLPQRHPHLQKYLHSTSGPKLKLKQLDATNMSCFDDNYLSGINASAVVHEIISYAGGLESLNIFFKESFRTLKPGGVLVYRDPEGVIDKNQLVRVHFKNPIIRLFTHIFLPKFLDLNCSKLAQSGRKSEKYDPKSILITFYKKNESFTSSYDFFDYLNLKSYEIDFSRSYVITMPRGLCREIERHYLTYLHQCNPLIYLKCIPTVDSELYILNYLAHSTKGIVEQFLQKQKLKKRDFNIIPANVKCIIDDTIINNTKAIEYGIPLHFSTKDKAQKLIKILKEYDFNPTKCLIPIGDGDYLLDYRVFGVLFDYYEKIFDLKNGPINDNDTIHAKWLKREGEETYIYYSDEELIIKVAEVSLAMCNNINKLVLCPISTEHNKFIPRLCYDEVLKNSLDINDIDGYPIEIKEGKRIIHFKKMPLNDAIKIYEDIVKLNPEYYNKLQTFINSLKENLWNYSTL